MLTRIWSTTLLQISYAFMIHSKIIFKSIVGPGDLKAWKVKAVHSAVFSRRFELVLTDDWELLSGFVIEI